jgi:CRISPR/Cas system CSM-associated protein Csm3 (group 7 of RAMP superfamily)
MKPESILTGSIEFLEFWHAGSGEAGPGDVDDTPLRDRRGLPYLPGRTLKGLFHEAFCELAAWGAVPGHLRPEAGQIDILFGSEGNRGRTLAGLLRFSDAVLPEEAASYIVASGMQEGLFEVLSATAIEESSVAKARSLRRFEVAVPANLVFSLRLESSGHDGSPPPAAAIEWLGAAARLVRRAGKFRNNGFGRCIVEIQPPSND